ncbi:hypothetical protein ACSBR2_014707 [Camellia fascicularis]
METPQPSLILTVWIHSCGGTPSMMMEIQRRPCLASLCLFSSMGSSDSTLSSSQRADDEITTVSSRSEVVDRLLEKLRSLKICNEGISGRLGLMVKGDNSGIPNGVSNKGCSTQRWRFEAVMWIGGRRK